MKHIFVVNPNAGAMSPEKEIRQKLDRLINFTDYEIYITTGPHDATRYVKEYCAVHAFEEVCFYACGGDGTLNEVVTGVIGYPKACVGCYPSGSGDDYVKYFRDMMDIRKEYFCDLNRLTTGKPMPVDVMKVTVLEGKDKGVHYSINVCNFGFDASVAKIMQDVKRLPVIGGESSYNTALVLSLLTGRFNKIKVVADDEVVHDKLMLLCTLSNGQYVGGGFKVGPRSVVDDGLIELGLVRSITLYRFLRLLKPYTLGKHFEEPYAKKIFKYRRCKVVELSKDSPFAVSIDGEIITGKRFRIEQMPLAVRFMVPIP